MRTSRELVDAPFQDDKTTSSAATSVNNRQRRVLRRMFPRRTKPVLKDTSYHDRWERRAGLRLARLRWCTYLASACAGGLATMFVVLSFTSLRMMWSDDPPSSSFSVLFVRDFVRGRKRSVVPTQRDRREIEADEAVGRAWGDSEGKKGDAEPTKATSDLGSVLDETARLLFASDRDDDGDGSAADAVVKSYTERHDSSDFRFYAYDDLPPDYTWRRNAQCVQDAMNHPSKRWGKLRLNVTSDCDWGQTVCDQTCHSSSQYSKRRYKRNGDVVLSKIFAEYGGGGGPSHRTLDPSRADLFVVPWPSAAHCECASFRKRCSKVLPPDAVRTGLLDRLGYLNSTTAHMHLFFHSIVSDQAHPTVKRDIELVATIGTVDYRCGANGGARNVLGRNCGHMVVPYVNTNSRYQPDLLDALLRNDDGAWWTSRPRRYSLAAILSASIAGNGGVREQFVRDADTLFPGGAIGGLPVMIVDSGKGRRMEDERGTMDLYRDSVFCPCLRGDTPTQKRLFDALLNGCIPVVLSYNSSSSSKDGRYPSHFAEGATSIQDTYPFARGTFHGEPTMGIDYESMMVSVDGACGLPCMGPTLEAVMADGDRLLQLRRNIMRYVRLFAFGMGGKGLRWPDAVSAVLVQARHYVDSVEASNAPAVTD